MNNSELYDLEPICILNGQIGLHDTERIFYKQAVKRNIDIYVIDNIFQDTDRLKALKYLKPKTILLGTTGTYRDDLDKSKEIFVSIGFLPNNVIFTMGEDYFSNLLKDTNVKCFKIQPMNFSDDSIEINEI